MRRLLLLVVAVVVCVGGAAVAVLFHSEAAQDAMLVRLARARGTRFHTELLEPGSLHIVFCGTGSPLADADRASACIAVFTDGRCYVVDTGSGAAARAQLFQLPLGALNGVLITHVHSDHIGDLGQIALNSWALGRTQPLTVYGPPGIERVAAGMQEAYALDAGYRIAHHTPGFFPPEAAAYDPRPVVIPTDDDTALILEEGDLRITGFRVSHEPVTDAYGYRIDYRGRSVIFSGDTIPHPNLVRVGADVDVMVHEGLAPHMVLPAARVLAESGKNPRGATILHDIPEYHTAPVDAARLANEANARLLVFSHILPPLPNAMAERMFLRGVPEIRPRGTLIGWDGLALELPAGSDAIVRRSLN